MHFERLGRRLAIISGATLALALGFGASRIGNRRPPPRRLAVRRR